MPKGVLGAEKDAKCRVGEGEGRIIGSEVGKASWGLGFCKWS